MRHNFICEVCNRNFKTTQHLRQHINKKKKCIPIVIDKSSSEFSETDNNNNNKNDDNNNNDNTNNNINTNNTNNNIDTNNTNNNIDTNNTNNNSDNISMLSLNLHKKISTILDNKNEIFDTQNLYLNVNDLINLDELKDCKVIIRNIINFVLKYNILLEENVKQEKKIKELECDNIYFKNVIDKFKNLTIDFYKCHDIYKSHDIYKK